MLEFGVDTAAEAKALEELVSLRKELLAEQSKQGENSLTISRRSGNLQDDEVSRLEKAIAKTEELVEANARARAEYEAQSALQKSASDLVERNKQAELDNIKSIVDAFKAAEAERQKAREDQEAANKSAEQELSLLEQKSVLLQVEKDHGKDSLDYKGQALYFEKLNLRTKLEAEGVEQDTIKAIMDQLSIQARVTQEIIDSADAAERLKNNLEVASTFRVGGDLGEFANVAGGLDAFGGAGSFKYGGSQKFKPGPDKKTQKSDLQILREQLTLESALVGQTEARQRVIQALGVEFSKKNPQTVASLEKQIQLTKELIQEEQQRQDLINFVADSMGDSFMSMVEGTKSVKDAFREMASDIVRELYRVLVVQQMVNSAKTFLGGFFADGGAFSGGSQIQAYADGGVVGSPTYFGMSGGKTGLMGEAGPEAIMPLSRGANGKLGVQAEGVGGVTINQNINISTGVQQTVRSEIKSMMPQIAEQSKAAVLDAKRRGGSYGSKF
jgi:hypothetical protein